MWLKLVQLITFCDHLPVTLSQPGTSIIFGPSTCEKRQERQVLLNRQFILWNFPDGCSYSSVHWHSWAKCEQSCNLEVPHGKPELSFNLKSWEKSDVDKPSVAKPSVAKKKIDPMPSLRGICQKLSKASYCLPSTIQSSVFGSLSTFAHCQGLQCRRHNAHVTERPCRGMTDKERYL